MTPGHGLGAQGSWMEFVCTGRRSFWLRSVLAGARRSPLARMRACMHSLTHLLSAVVAVVNGVPRVLSAVILKGVLRVVSPAAAAAAAAAPSSAPPRAPCVVSVYRWRRGSLRTDAAVGRQRGGFRDRLARTVRVFVPSSPALPDDENNARTSGRALSSDSLHSYCLRTQAHMRTQTHLAANRHSRTDGSPPSSMAFACV